MKSIFKSEAGKLQIIKAYDEALQKLDGQLQSSFIHTSFGDTHLLTNENEGKEVLLLLHGASSNASSWLSDWEIYKKDFRIIAIDIIGEAGKSAETRLPYTTNDYANWLNEVLTALDVQKVNIVGLSQGGWLAIRFASSFPQKVNKIVLLAPAGIVPTEGKFILKAILYSLLGTLGKKKINKLVLGGQVVDPKVRSFMDLTQSNFQARMDKEYLFKDQELSKVTMPTLFIGGAKDVIRSADKIAARLQAVLPNFKSIIDPAKGHVLVDTAATINQFLKG
ncbi:alpha/beta fold hydrolase [Sphingobacterium sp. Mn56C]|uniref:alpha/beta fold hydrolase n=1 Tax=Sphingobacterium sp. Mn56C TaxID=3395261 RepID=UPI003BC25014